MKALRYNAILVSMRNNTCQATALSDIMQVRAVRRIQSYSSAAAPPPNPDTVELPPN